MDRQTLDLGGPVSFVDHGGDGPVMVCVHGLGGSLENWMLAGPQLAAAGHHVLCVELAGFGATPLAGRESDLATNRSIISTFIHHVSAGSPVVLIGHSMGGLLAMMQAVAEPQTVGRLILLDPACPPAITSPMKPIPHSLVAALASRPRLGAAVTSALARMEGPRRLINNAMHQYCADSSTLDPVLVDALVEVERERISRGNAYLGYMQAYRSMSRRLSNLPAYDSEVVMPVAMPTLLVAGAVDTLVPTPHIRRVAGLRHDWAYREMAGVGHNPQMEAPQQLVELVLEWLDQPHTEVKKHDSAPV